MTVFAFSHPLIQHKLAIIRNKETDCKCFREVLSEIAMLMFYEISRDFPLEDVEVETPICKTTCQTLSSDTNKTMPVIVPILRAGLGMVDGNNIL